MATHSRVYCNSCNNFEGHKLVRRETRFFRRDGHLHFYEHSVWNCGQCGRELEYKIIQKVNED